MIRLADYIFKYVSSLNVKDVFMLSGGGCMHLCDALGRSGLNYVCCLHEQSAAVAALAYAQYKNDVGVALVTSGPGATNAITGAAAAWVESVPLLLISGQVKTEDMAGHSGVRAKGVQELPIVDMVKPVTKYAKTVLDPNKIKLHLEEAAYIAKNGRPGPVWLDIPLNIQSAMIDENALEGFAAPACRQNDLVPDARQTLEMIAASQRPVILAGYGVRTASAVSDFLKLVDALGIPVLTTWKAADILPFDHPLFMGRPGTAGQRAANFTLQNSDLVISIGARLDFPQTGYNQMLFAREAQKIIVDVDPAELKKYEFKVDLPVCADAGDYIKALINAKPERKRCDNWLKRCAGWNEKYGVILPEHRDKKNFASIYALVEAISDCLESNDLIVPGSSGMGSDVPYQVIRVKDGQRMFNSPGIGSMGFGIPSALGACVASGGRRVVCTNGDGGFQMNIQDLETIKGLNLPVIFFVINNEGYASIRNTQRNYFDGFYVGSSKESGVSLPDISKIGKAYGYKIFSIRKNKDICDTVKKVFNCREPVICEVKIDPMETLAFRSSSFLLPDGTAVTTPPEDLAPFLPRGEFYENMLIKPLNKTGINLCSILFDLDGTLIDSGAGITSSMLHALKNCGCAGIGENDIKNTIGLPLLPMVKKLLPDVSDEKAAEIAKSYREHYTNTGLYDSVPYDGIPELLKTLSKEYDLYIVTSKPAQLAENITKKLNIRKYFKSVYGPDLGLEPKKKSELIAELIRDTGLHPQNCVMVGDRAEDAEAADANNVGTVGVSYGYGTKEELGKAILIAGTAHDLMKILF